MATYITMNETNTIPLLKAMGATIYTRNSNHHVAFEYMGRKMEICAKSNREYKLVNEFGTELAHNENPMELLKSL